MDEASRAILAQIEAAFPARLAVPIDPLVNSVQGDEPQQTAIAFADKHDWTVLDGHWLDRVPNGQASALHFLSDEAICFFIPAYLRADLAGQLDSADPVFALTHGLDLMSRDARLSPRSTETRLDYATRRWSRLTAAQADAVVAYLEWRAAKDLLGVEPEIPEALSTYWYARAGRS